VPNLARYHFHNKYLVHAIVQVAIGRCGLLRALSLRTLASGSPGSLQIVIVDFRVSRLERSDRDEAVRAGSQPSI